MNRNETVNTIWGLHAGLIYTDPLVSIHAGQVAPTASIH